MAEADSSRVMAGGTSMPRGLVVILASTGLLVTTLALQQFASVISPVLLALVLVVGVHPLTGLLRRRGAPEWLAITCTLLVLVAIIVGLAVAFALSLAQLGTVLPAYQDRFTAFLDDLEAWLATLASAATSSRPRWATSRSATSQGSSQTCSSGWRARSRTSSSCC